jgi:hypothetical protein
MMFAVHLGNGMVTPPNPAHAPEGGFPRLLPIGRHWPAASDEQRWPDDAN